MEARVAKLESHVEYIRRDISEIKSDTKASAGDLVSLKIAYEKIDGRLDAIDRNMVSKGQLAIYALLTVLAIGSGGWWIIQQYLAPILKALPK